ncbi:response regulator transcription factor [Actinacidiphila glaucinigra]|uniref:DNA-binding response regulator, NarL/FixJ family, contains REC and HTH domains n=1 Tax=Actinacidiphila glaucinigra TaxID=235986 RepID=A0A239J9F2_9ACTN|nr:response regulator transcription factor [Actinacidiphila glaucinigra]SNT02507.1 DNA-binding response regulator, NarL/FixJ family, contains REC and HTH domains [Actinacidiphila glaucinigra]
MIRVVVVDDETLVRTALRRILESAGDIRVVADCDSRAALAAVRGHAPDLVLLDTVMPEPDGLTVLRAVRALPDPPAVAMLTGFDTSAHITAAMRAGATGFLLKDTAVATLIDAVRVLASGGTVFTPTVSRAVVDGYLGTADARETDPAGTALDRLTGREREVLLLVAGGLSNLEIAERLYITVATVKDHVRALLRKLDAPNRVSLAITAHRAGLSPGSAA